MPLCACTCTCGDPWSMSMSIEYVCMRISACVALECTATSILKRDHTSENTNSRLDVNYE
jgi:hypothetical protein